ncbi:Opioid growth factor receptor [Bagarius yarrelli]|uniref:Opioid growth factor receptor n=1 Tax=Bagarius yarrelli TaxID=175774 RepID=A0A556V748_BAGYA|nr:Opioid growth factor receptor [Bagarius yarrelli]
MMEDDLVCEYDSTWDSESDVDDLGTENTTRRACPEKNKKAKPGFWSNSSSRNLRAAKDMQNYRHGYPCLNRLYVSFDWRVTSGLVPAGSLCVSDVYIETFHSEWKSDYKRLERVHSYIQWNMHNNLRITRILKSLGELGFEHFQAPLVRFFLEETLVKKNLSSVKRSVLDYFLFAVRDKRKRRELISYAFQHFEPKDKFVWCPRKIQKRFKKKAEAKRQDSPSRNKRDGEKREDDEMQRSEGSSVDPEPREEGSSVDPLPLNNGTHLDNGEMDITSTEKYNDDKKEAQGGLSEKSSNQELKNDEEAVNISVSQKESESEKKVLESPKHSLKSSPCSERAGKLARTKDNTGLGIADHRRSSGDTIFVSPPEKLTDLDTQDEENTNGLDMGELMDTDSSGGGS